MADRDMDTMSWPAGPPDAGAWTLRAQPLKPSKIEKNVTHAPRRNILFMPLSFLAG
jgi:hypothetical protein